MSIIRQASGIYHADFRRKSLAGGRLALSLRTRSLRDARRRHALLQELLDAERLDVLERLRIGDLSIHDIDNALSLEGSGLQTLQRFHAGITLRHAARRLLEDLQMQGARESSQEIYRRAIRGLQRGFGEDFILADLRESQLRRWFLGLNLAPRTQIQRRTVYNRLWRLAILEEAKEAQLAGVQPRLVDNPWQSIHAAKPDLHDEESFVILQPDELAVLLDANDGLPEAAFMACAYLAGLRLAETYHLRHSDVDLDVAELHVRARKRPRPWKPKTRRSVRSIPISDDLVNLFKAHLARGFSGKDYLFVDPKRRPLTAQSAHAMWKRAYKRAGIAAGREDSGIVYHTGRHSFVSWALSAGEPPTRVAAYVGDTVQVLLTTYAHLMPDDKLKVRDAIQGLTEKSREISRGSVLRISK